MSSPRGHRTPAREDAPTPRRSGRNAGQSPQGNGTPRQGNRTPRQGNRTPRGQRTPAREDAINSPRRSPRTPRRGLPTPSRTDSTIDTPMRWGGARREVNGENEIPASPAHSAVVSPPGGKLIFFILF